MSTLTGTGRLLRHLIRRDGRHFLPWVALATALPVSSVIVYPQIFPTEQDRATLAATIGGNPALGLIFGPARDLGTVDGFNAWRCLALGGLLAALGAIFAVTRATRAQEDTGRAELLASGAVGRSSSLAAAVVLALAGSLVLGAVAGTGTVLAGGRAHASILLGAGFAATGWLCAGIAAVAAQLGSTARAANSIAVAAFGLMFLLRGVLYSLEAPEWTTWANPLGWVAETQPATLDRWWPLAPVLALALALVAVAFVLRGRRDYGVGFIATRPGRARGRIRGSWGLILRLNRGPIVTWTISFVAVGAILGHFAASVHDILDSNAAVQQILAAGATTPVGLVEEFLVTIMSMIGILASIPGVQTMMKMRTEEAEGRLELLATSGATRPRYFAGNALLALAAPSVYMMIGGTLVAGFAASADIGVGFRDAVLQAAATVPAVWTVVALAVAVTGLRPGVGILAWAGVLISFTLTILGPTFELDDAAMAVSPFWHVPRVTAESPDLTGLLWVAGVALVLLAAGAVGFRRRDLGR